MVNLKLLQELKDNNFPQDTLNSIVYQKSIKDEDYEIFITQDLIDDNYKDDEFSAKLAYPLFEEIWNSLPKAIINNENEYNLMLSNKYIAYEYVDYSIESLYSINVYDNDITEAIAKLWLTLKSLNLLDDIHDSGVITNL